ncbi:unnamed protein product [Ceratitis capitata]|uniref:(Mediterranean fruit fly) hypothetical protein n=1 Tax=Ceratitis capitata TaxID=7213 RepID=A0A811VJ78_CERCA|nr:unnamed protein product [Ceratitis capitata]
MKCFEINFCFSYRFHVAFKLSSRCRCRRRQSGTEHASTLLMRGQAATTGYSTERADDAFKILPIGHYCGKVFNVKTTTTTTNNTAAAAAVKAIAITTTQPVIACQPSSHGHTSTRTFSVTCAPAFLLYARRFAATF